MTGNERRDEKAATTSSAEEPIATSPSTPVEKEVVEKEIENDSSSIDVDEKHENQNTIIPVMSRRSIATSNNPDSVSDLKSQKRSWSNRINPLKRNPPPVPKERGISREYTAGRFSRLVFHWITPLMSVSIPQCLVQD